MTLNAAQRRHLLLWGMILLGFVLGSFVQEATLKFRPEVLVQFVALAVIARVVSRWRRHPPRQEVRQRRGLVLVLNLIGIALIVVAYSLHLLPGTSASTRGIGTYPLLIGAMTCTAVAETVQLGGEDHPGT